MDFFYKKIENKGPAAARIGIKGHAPLSQFLNSSFILQLRMDIIHTHKGEEDYKIITAKRAVIEGTIMSKVMQEHGYKIVAKNPHACMWDESHISLDIYLEK